MNSIGLLKVANPMRCATKRQRIGSAILSLLTVIAGMLTVAPAAEAAGKFTVTAQVGSQAIDLGSSVRIAGAVSPARPGKLVQLEQLTRGKWRVVATKRLNKQSGYGFRAQPTKAGVAEYRVVKAADRQRSVGISPVRRVNVYRWHYLDDRPWIGYDNFDYGPVFINGNSFAHGVYAYHWDVGDEAYMEINLSRRCTTLTGTVGLADSSSSGTIDNMVIMVDSNSIFDANLSVGSATPISFDVTGGFRLRVETTQLQTGDDYSYPSIGGGRIRCAF